jgi:hypothetical protein
MRDGKLNQRKGNDPPCAAAATSLKAPPHQFEATVASYRHIIGVQSLETSGWKIMPLHRPPLRNRVATGGLQGFWVASPAGIIHLIAQTSEDVGPDCQPGAMKMRARPWISS